MPGSLPVLFFGDAFAASIATVGINPSKQEYRLKKGEELTGSLRRFETLNSLDALSRDSLTDKQADTAIQRMRCYFNADCRVYGWFSGLSRVVEGMGASFRDRSAVHLDLVQEATDPVWSQLAQADPKQNRNGSPSEPPFSRTPDRRISVSSSGMYECPCLHGSQPNASRPSHQDGRAFGQVEMDDRHRFTRSRTCRRCRMEHTAGTRYRTKWKRAASAWTIAENRIKGCVGNQSEVTGRSR